MLGFNFLGETIFFSQGRQNYAMVHKLFAGLAVEGSTKFRKDLKELKDVNEMVKRIGDFAADAITIGLTAGMQQLLSNGVYTVGVDAYAELFVPHCMPFWLEAYEEFVEEYSNIVCTQQEMEEYRRLRRESRTKFVGGGFGVKNAVSGAIKADILNGMTGAAHSFVNSIGNARTSAQTEKAKRELLNDVEMQELLVEGVYKTIYMLMFVNMKLLNDETGMDFIMPSEKDQDKVHAIIQNLNGNLIPEAQINGILSKAVELDPSNENTYFLALYRNGDKNCEIEKLGEYMGVYVNGKSIHEVKERLVFEQVKDKIYFMNANKDNEAAVIAVKKEIDEVFEYYGLDNSETLMKYIQAPLDYIDQKNRTVDGVLYETKEEASAARDDKEIIKQILDSKDLDTIAGYNEALEILKNTEFSDSKIKDNIEDILQKEQELRSRSLATIGHRMVLIKHEEYIIKETGKPYLYDLSDVVFFVSHYIFDKVIEGWKRIYQLKENEQFLVYVNSRFKDQESRANGILLTNRCLTLYDGANVNSIIPLSRIENIRGRYDNEIVVDVKGAEKVVIVIKSSRHEESVNRLAKSLMRMVEVAKNLKGELIEFSEQEIEANREKILEITDEVKADYKNVCHQLAKRIQSNTGYGKEMWGYVVATNTGNDEDFFKLVNYVCNATGIVLEKEDYPLLYFMNTSNGRVDSAIIISALNKYIMDEKKNVICEKVDEGYYVDGSGIFKTCIEYHHLDSVYKIKYQNLKSIDASEFCRCLGWLETQAKEIYKKYAK